MAPFLQTTNVQFLLSHFPEICDVMWRAHTLRLTVFPRSPANYRDATWWSDVADSEPDVYNLDLKKSELRQEGPYGEGKLALIAKSDRIDWLFTPIEDVETKPNTVPTIGSFGETSEAFSNLALSWLSIETIPSIRRIAYGAILMAPIEEVSNGYELLNKYLGSVELDSEASSDFFYQINRPRESALDISNLMINRLSKWSVARLRYVDISALVKKTLEPLELLACRLELDINTSPDFEEELPKDRLSNIFEELVGLGKEIAEKGDIT